MTRSLDLEYRMGLSTMRGRQTIYIPNWNEFVSITKSHLPEIVKFTAIGAGAPAEDQAREQKQISSAQLAQQIDQGSQAVGNPPILDPTAMVRQVLEKGGWTDVDDLFTSGDPGAPLPEGQI